MNEYQVIITPDAEKDLNELDDYITFILRAPDTAADYLRAIKERLLSLRDNPKRYRLMDDEPWHTLGVRRLNVRNFAVFYTVLDEYREVYIQNIIYQRRDIDQVLDLPGQFSTDE